MNGIPLFEQGDARDALKKRCREAKIPIKLLQDLVEAEIEQIGKQRKRGLRERFDQLLDPTSGSDVSENQED
jgi:hypothetical protein